MKKLAPPPDVKCMTSLNREAFTKTIKILTIVIPIRSSKTLMPKLKKFMLKMPNLKALQQRTDEEWDLFINPDVISTKEHAVTLLSEEFPSLENKVASREIEITYKNWTKEDILAAVLPDNTPGVAAYTSVGHIIHLNLREHVLPYKFLIAEVLLDKSPKHTLVVNKVDNIDKSDNQFRSFKMEVLAGTGGMVTTVKENGCSFSFDFSKVYWNSRLSTEHKRVVDMIMEGDILFDVMSGVGPFSVPCAKKLSHVYANDMNPHSYEWLVKNGVDAKVTDSLQTYNMDGKDFIRTIMKEKLWELYASSSFPGKVHITMNLPSVAPEFLSRFVGLLHEKPNLADKVENNLPIVHCYMFTFNFCKDYAVNRVGFPLGFCKKDLALPSPAESEISSETLADNILPSFRDYVIEVFDIRRVSTNKEMVRVSFRIPKEVLFRTTDDIIIPPCKKRKCD